MLAGSLPSVDMAAVASRWPLRLRRIPLRPGEYYRSDFRQAFQWVRFCRCACVRGLRVPRSPWKPLHSCSGLAHQYRPVTRKYSSSLKAEARDPRPLPVCVSVARGPRRATETRRLHAKVRPHGVGGLMGRPRVSRGAIGWPRGRGVPLGALTSLSGKRAEAPAERGEGRVGARPAA